MHRTVYEIRIALASDRMAQEGFENTAAALMGLQQDGFGRQHLTRSSHENRKRMIISNDCGRQKKTYQ